ncbi:MAG: GWxTD domain-containing protein, partial [Candidatus Zixiibacteriota bacterium]
VRNLKLKLKDFNRKPPHLSDVELVQAVKTSDEKYSIFDKGDYTLVPSVTHEYGNDDNFRLLFYMEIYQGENIAESVRVETVLRHSLKGMVYRDSLTTKLNDGITRQFRDISLENLFPGDYELILTLRGRRNKKVAEKHRDFNLVWSQKTLLKYDYKSVLGQLSLIAKKSDIEILKKSKTFEERLSAVDAFWLARDPTPGTEENEAQKQFYHRIYIANQNFSYLYQTGWKTDRGRIYIMYGEPDQIDDYPIVPNQSPYQEWHYYQGTRYRKFVFIDYNEDGDYRLQYPYDGLNVRPDF